jgi:hypothetical protein
MFVEKLARRAIDSHGNAAWFVLQRLSAGHKRVRIAPQLLDNILGKIGIPLHRPAKRSAAQ